MGTVRRYRTTRFWVRRMPRFVLLLVLVSLPMLLALVRFRMLRLVFHGNAPHPGIEEEAGVRWVEPDPHSRLVETPPGPGRARFATAAAEPR